MGERYSHKPVPPQKLPAFEAEAFLANMPDGDPQPPLKGLSTCPVYNLSPAENALWQKEINIQNQSLFHLADFLTYASEHISREVAPVYQAIVKATTVEELVPFTMHLRSLVRNAAYDKIQLITNQPIKQQKIPEGYARWPGMNWEAPRKPT